MKRSARQKLHSADQQPVPHTTAQEEFGLEQASDALQRAQHAPQTMRPQDMLQLQRSIGNQALNKLVNPIRQTMPANGDPAVQRRIVIPLNAYASGINVPLVANLTAAQIKEYLGLAVYDDYRYALQMVEDDVSTALKAQWKKIVANPTGEVAEIPNLVTEVNRILDALPAPLANKDSRYATKPSAGYEHQPLKDGSTWGSDDKMRSEFGAKAGSALAKEDHPTTAPRIKEDHIVLKQLSWEMAKKVLPRPLINLIFDVRMQLETAGATVIDERTADQKARKDKSPSEAGTLRSWHQDSAGVLPANNFDAAAVPAHATALHTHYNAHSQSGAGASIKDAATSAQGYAEYTGTGSNWEHNTKVVLDYINKRVYLTLTHYQYWALIKKDDSYQFWEGETQNLVMAKGKLAKERPGAEAIMMSPWMEILFA